MATTTTLITFMVRTPPNTRSVDLYGSWDNFMLPYTMSRDSRLGREHWTGCHTFENIICDGDVNGLSATRRGGLKMGGTYWYYYKLDDEIEFHNSTEPATTRCPLLPGQLVNELEVPFAFSGSRRRDESVSSTSSERRTLDPHAKFLNPRPSPDPPRLVRLNTSPTTLSMTPQTETASDDPSEPTIANCPEELEESTTGSSRIFHLPRMPSLDDLLKAGSRKQNPASLRRPFQLPEDERSISSIGEYRDIIDWLPNVHTDMVSESHGGDELSDSSSRTQVKPPRGALLLRSHSDDAIPVVSFGEHRRQQSRSRSRGETPRNPMVFDNVPHLELSHVRNNEQPLSALIEVNTPESAPIYGPLTGRRIALEALEGRHEIELQLEKRLPTLPSTPSSVYPATSVNNSPPRAILSEIAYLDSRFSATTIDTTCHLDSMLMGEEQCKHLLTFTTSDRMSSEIESTVNVTPSSTLVTQDYFGYVSRPRQGSVSTPPELASDEGYSQLQYLSSAISYTSIDSTVSTTPTTSYGEAESVNSSRFSAATSIRSSEAQYQNFQHYSLPEVENASEVTLKRYNSDDRAVVEDNRSKPNQNRSSLSHSESMQQLLDELSYLSAMIQH